MADEKKISSTEADKERLLNALRELRKEGVTLIDDRGGRPAVLSAKPRADVKDIKRANAKSTEYLILESLDKMFVEDEFYANDPYNSDIK